MSLTASTWCGHRTAYFTVNGNHSLNHLTFNGHNGCAGNGALYAVFDGTGSLTVAGNLNLVNGVLHGALNVGGNVLIGSAFKGGPLQLNFVGNGSQSYTNSGGDEPDGNYTVNKSGGALSLASNMQCTASGQNLTITSGTLDLSGYNLTVNSTVTVSSGATLTGVGSATCSSTPCTAGSLVNNGTVQ